MKIMQLLFTNWKQNRVTKNGNVNTEKEMLLSSLVIKQEFKTQ